VQALLRNARFRQYHAKLTVIPGDFDVDDFGVARAQPAQFTAYGTGIAWVVEPLLPVMISGPKAIPARIPAGDPRVGSGSKCNAVRHSFPTAFCVRAKSNTEPSKSSASNPVGAEKRHTAKTGAAPRVRGAEGAEKARTSEAVPLRANRIGQVAMALRQLRNRAG
jgi:hypothetical protein